MRRLRNIRLIDAVSFAAITAAAIFLFLNHNYFSIPDSDIFQYIDDGRQYIQLKLPKNIQMPPVNATLIALGAKLLQSYDNPEILSAHLINIAAAVVTLVLIYLLIKPYSPYLGFILILLLITSPLFVFQSLNVTSEVLFCTAVTLTFVLYQRKRVTGAYICVGCSFLVRYEAALLLLAMVVVDLVKRRGKNRTLRAFTVGVIPIIIWLFILNFHNYWGNILGNQYIREAVSYRQRIPQFELITRLPFLLADYFSTTAQGYVYTLGAAGIYGTIGLSVWVLIASGEPIFWLLCLFTFLYITSHSFFPYSPDRYLYPVLWCLYATPLLAFWRHTTKRPRRTVVLAITSGAIFCCVLCYIIIGNFQKTFTYYQNPVADNLAYPRYKRSEIRMAADWLNATVFSRPTVVIAYEPWIMNYFTHNKMVSFLSLPYTTYQKCDSIECLMKGQGLNTQRCNVLFIQQSNSFTENDSSPDATNLHVEIFNNFEKAPEARDFVFRTLLSKNGAWAGIFQYRPVR